jgi:hypothetical protein
MKTDKFMNIYKVTWNEWDRRNHDSYDSAVVVAYDEDSARNMNPETGETIDWTTIDWATANKPFWAQRPEDITVELVGITDLYPAPAVICASFNSG